MAEREARPIYAQTGNWNRKDWLGNQGIFRVLAEDRDRIIVVQIGYIEHGEFKSYRTPTTKQRIKIWGRDTTDQAVEKGDLFHIDERGIPPAMRAARVPESGEDLDYDRRKAIVNYIEDNWGDEVLKDNGCYIRAIKVTATHFNTDGHSVRRWYTRYLFFGRHANALVAQTWNRGAPGKSRRDLKYDDGTYVPRGCKPKKQIDEGDTRDLRKLMSPKLYREYHTYLKIHAWGTGDRFPVVHERFKAQRYAFNQDPITKERVVHQIRISRLPNDKYMRKVGREIYRHERDARDKARRNKDEFRPTYVKGSARDIVHEQIPVLDIDATSIANGVLFPDLPDEVREHGKPTVYLGVCRGSAAIVGYYVTFEPENGRGYLAGLFSCYTPKDRELLRWEVPYLKGFVYGCTAKVFFDRGPGIGKLVLEIMEKLRTNMLMAAPYRPQGKGHVEGAMGNTQRDLSDLPGSTFTRGSAEKDKIYLKKAKKQAVSLKVFMQQLLTSISDHNLKMGSARDHTPHMVKSSVIPCPADIYWYNKGRIRGDASQQWLWSPEKIFRTLCSTQVLKAPNGVVTLKGKRVSFTSAALEDYWDSYVRRHGVTPEVTVLEVVQSTDHAMWEQPDGTLGALHATSRTANAYGDGTELTIAASNRKRSSLAYDGLIRGLAIEQEKIDMTAGRVSKEKMKKVKKVDQNATGFILPPRKEMLKDAATSLNTGNAESVFETIGVKPPPPREVDVTVDSLYAFRSGQRLLLDITQ
jgi:hypothetical protein